MNIFDKAKEAKDAAAVKAAAFKDRAASAVSDLSEHAAARASEIFGAGFDQVTGAVADFNTALPIVRKAGYSLEGVTLQVSLSPSINASFKTTEAITDEQVATIESEHADNKLALMLVHTLRRASKLQSAIVVGGLMPQGLSVSIGLSPSVAIKFA
jgi:hypothetical protein